MCGLFLRAHAAVLPGVPLTMFFLICIFVSTRLSPPFPCRGSVQWAGERERAKNQGDRSPSVNFGGGGGGEDGALHGCGLGEQVN